MKNSRSCYRHRVLWAALLALAPAAVWSAPAAPVTPPPPKLRLDDTAKPVRYLLDLRVVPTEATFTGTVVIDLLLRRQTALLWLNATALTIQDARIEERGRTIPAHSVPGDEDFLGFRFDQPIGPGRARLRVVYQGRMPEQESDGLFRRKEGENWYAFTQFEPLDARRAVPCFDEPAFKVPWQLTLHVKKEHLAFSNTPIMAARDEPNGMKRVRFAATRPLPSYLVALAVGPLEVVEAGKVGKKRTPVRIIVPRGHAKEAGFAARATPAILALLEEYFGTPYPYEKLDQLAVPQLGLAMENPGLVVYAQPLMLARPERQTAQFQRNFASTCAHELAHQWFGDLVTMAWWNDLWLNEAFATWLDPKIVDRWQPRWDVRLENVAGRNSFAMNQDSLATARSIRQPIATKHDIRSAFDGITYNKGAAVLDMFEAWIGADAFREGVRRYLAQHAWGNATTQDFIAALSAAAGRDLAPAFRTFLDQPGVPLITVDLRCDPAPRLQLAQNRYLPLGSAGSRNQTWQIPIRVKYDAGPRTGNSAVLLSQPAADVSLGSSAGPCPRWVLVNERQAGYYRVLYKGNLLPRLLGEGSKHLSLPERAGLVGDIDALVQSGDLPAGEALAIIPQLLRERNRHITTGTMRFLPGREMLPAELRPNYARFIRRTYGAMARALGWKPRPGEDDDMRLLRPRVLALVADSGEDPELMAEAAQLARRWLEDRHAVDGDLVSTVLRIAAQNGDRALFDRFHAAARAARDAEEREDLLGAMASFRDPAIRKTALALLLTDEFHPEEAMTLLFGWGGERQTRLLTYDFVKEHFDALVAKAPRFSAASLIFVAGGVPDAEHQADVESFFRERAAKVLGGPRALSQVIERIRLSRARRDAQLPSLTAFLKAQ